MGTTRGAQRGCEGVGGWESPWRECRHGRVIVVVVAVVASSCQGVGGGVMVVVLPTRMPLWRHGRAIVAVVVVVCRRGIAARPSLLLLSWRWQFGGAVTAGSLSSSRWWRWWLRRASTTVVVLLMPSRRHGEAVIVIVVAVVEVALSCQAQGARGDVNSMLASWRGCRRCRAVVKAGWWFA